MIDQTKLKHIIDAIKTSTDYHTFDKGKALISNKRIQNGEYDDQNIRINLKGMTSVYSVAAGIQNNKVYYTCSCPAFDANPFFACKHIVALGGFLHKFNETIRRVKTVKYHPEGIPQQTVEKKAIQRTSKFFKLNTLKTSEAHLKALNIPKVPENEWLFFIDRTYYSTRLELTHKEDNTRTFTIHAEVLHQSIQLTCNCNEMKDPLCTHEKNAFALFFMENGLLANSFIKDRLASEMASKLLLSAIDIKSLTSLYFAEGEFFVKLTDPQSLERHLYSLLNHKNRFHHEPSIPIIDFEFNLVWFWSLSPREEFRPQLMLGDPYKNKSKGFKSFRAISYMLLCLENKKGPHLIIVPKSLLHNWESEWLNFSNKGKY